MLGEDPSEAEEPYAGEEMDVEAEGGDWSDLLVNWLAELVFLFDTEQFVPTEVTIAQCEPPRCAGRLRGFRLDQEEGAGAHQGGDIPPA